MKTKPLDLRQIVTITTAVNPRNTDGTVVVLYAHPFSQTSGKMKCSLITENQVEELYQRYKAKDPEVLHRVEIVSCLGWDRDPSDGSNIFEPIETNISRGCNLQAYIVGMEA